jgi:hypothetical protein
VAPTRLAAALVVLALALLPATGAGAPPAAGGPPILEPPAAPPRAPVPAPAADSAAPPPTIQDGIGPGSALQQSGQAGSFICTAAFLLRDPRTATYYLATAGHCLVEDQEDPEAYNGREHPDKVMRTIEVCVAGCIGNALSLGTYVELEPNSVTGYHPVAFAQSAGVGGDFGLVELPADVHDLLRPEMPQWGGPNGLGDAGLGDALVHYGHGTYCCPVAGGVASRTPADQGRAAAALSAGGESFSAVGWITGGDSGSGIALAEPDALGVLHGAGALGVITHGVEGAGTVFYGTTLRHGLAMAAREAGLRLELVPAGDPLTLVPDPDAGGSIAIASPGPGATVRPVSGAVPVVGNASVDGAPPGGGVRVEVALDDPRFGADSLLPVSGNASWTATWYTAGSPSGNHTLYARLVGPDGTLAEANRTVRLAKPGSGPIVTTGPGGTLGTATEPPGGDGNRTGGSEAGIPAPPLPLAASALALAAAAARARARLRGR